MGLSNGGPILISLEGEVMLLDIAKEGWLDRAACRDADNPSIWTSGSQKDSREAKRLCNTICPVRSHCFKWAMENNENTGVWGGLDTKERKELFY